MEINKINNKTEVEKGPQRLYEVTVKDVKTREIMYQQTGFGGLLCTVEKIISFQNRIVKGNHQNVGWGHPLLLYYSIQRLEEFVRGKNDEIITAVRELVKCKDDKERMKRIQEGEYGI